MSAAAVWWVLWCTHLGDHWLLGRALATGRPAPRSVLEHVAYGTCAKAVSLVVLVCVTGWCPSPGALLAGLALDALAHYWTDRLWLRPLVRLTNRSTGLRVAAAHVLDQSWQIGCVYAAALVITL